MELQYLEPISGISQKKKLKDDGASKAKCNDEALNYLQLWGRRQEWMLQTSIFFRIYPSFCSEGWVIHEFNISILAPAWSPVLWC